jgi:uncharacterized protein with beta-barrel porin domain
MAHLKLGTIIREFGTNSMLSNIGADLRKQLWSVRVETGWWFGTFSLFPYIGNFIIQLTFIFFRGVETTSQ